MSTERGKILEELITPNIHSKQHERMNRQINRIMSIKRTSRDIFFLNHVRASSTLLCTRAGFTCELTERTRANRKREMRASTHPPECQFSASERESAIACAY